MTQAAQNLMKHGSRKLCEAYDLSNDQEFKQAFHEEMASRHPKAYRLTNEQGDFSGEALLKQILANLRPGIEQLYL